MKTKEKILQASLMLFNEYGVSKVSQRKISTYLSISPGNLTYHFKRKEDIEEALYFELTKSISSDFREMDNQEINLLFISELMKKVFKYIHDYRFVFLDIIYLIRNNPKISNDYQKLISNRKKRFIEIYNHLISTHILRKEILVNEYEYLYTRLEILFDFYISSVEIKREKINSKELEKHLTLFLYTIFPYLTEKGKREFSMLFIIS